MANDDPEFPPELHAEVNAFAKDLSNTDDLGKVVRAHIRIERIIYAIVRELVPFPERLPNLNFHATVALALALGVTPDFGPPLRALGNLRNDFAHELESRLTPERVNGLYGTFNKEAREKIKQDYKRMQGEYPTLKDTAYSNLTPSDKFTLICLHLWGTSRRALRDLEQTTTVRPGRLPG